MTGPEHYQRGEQHLEWSKENNGEIGNWHLGQARAHFAAALAAATACANLGAMRKPDADEWWLTAGERSRAGLEVTR